MATLVMRDAFGKLVHRNVTGSGTQADPFIIVEREDGAGDSAFPIRDAYGHIVWLKADGAGTLADPMALSTNDEGGDASDLISSDADNALELGSDDKLYAASGGGGGVQFMSGTESPPTTPPSDVNAPAQYYNTATKFYWNWSIAAQAWVAVPKVYRALLYQEAYDNPLVTVLQNDFEETPTWTRQSEGVYRASSDEFEEVVVWNSTFVLAQHNNASEINSNFSINVGGGYVQITTRVSGVLADNQLMLTPIEILVYPLNWERP